MPAYFGHDPNGGSTMRNLGNTANVPGNFSCITPINWIAPAFLGFKGSVHWHYNAISAAPICSIYFQRDPGAFLTSIVPTNTNTPAGSANYVTERFINQVTGSGAGGAALTNQRTQAALSVSIPYYTSSRWSSTKYTNSSAPSTEDFEALNGGSLQITYLPNTETPTNLVLTVSKYCSIGTDFNLYWFINVPTLYIYANYPLAAV